jgi:hypothetical protein
MKLSFATILATALSLSQQCSAFAPIFFSTSSSTKSTVAPLHATTNTNTASNTNDRRTFFHQILNVIPVATIAIATTTIHPLSAAAMLIDKGSPSAAPYKAGQLLGAIEAKKRFQLAIQDIDELIENYPTISKSGGDSVRMYLGTVGVKSHMCGITKILKELRDEAEDVGEFIEASNDFEASLFQAEGAAYQSLFVEHSSAKGTPESLLATAKVDVLSMRKFMGDLAVQLSL